MINYTAIAIYVVLYIPYRKLKRLFLRFNFYLHDLAMATSIGTCLLRNLMQFIEKNEDATSAVWYVAQQLILVCCTTDVLQMRLSEEKWQWKC